MTDRRTAPVDLCRDLADGYETVHTDLYALTRAGDSVLRGKAVSRPPTGVDVGTRRHLVVAARKLVDCQFTAGGPSRPDPSDWRGFQRLGWRSHYAPRTWFPKHSDMLTFDPDNPVYRWEPDGSDGILQPPAPDEFRHAATRTLALIGSIARSHLGDAQHDACLALLRSTWGTLRQAGAFPDEARREQRLMLDVCREQLRDGAVCGRDIHARGLCRRHYDSWRHQQRAADLSTPA